MDKNTIIRILVEKLENEIRNSLKENLHKNPMAGTPLEGMFLLQIINEECENYRNFLSQSQDKINVTQNEIDIIISTASKNISRQVFDNMDDEDDDLITVDALTKFAEQQSARDAQSQKPTFTPKDEEAVQR